MALREVNIPQHISILYVQQEVVGDDTPALESVLQADVHRSKLLEEERDNNALLEALEKESEELTESSTAGTDEERAAKHQQLRKLERRKDDASARLGEVQKLLVEIEAETGPARAGELLAGLGFSKTDQVRFLAFSSRREERTDEFVCFLRRTCPPGPSREDGVCVSRSPVRSSASPTFFFSTSRAHFRLLPFPSCTHLPHLTRSSNNLDLNALAWLEDYLQTWPSTLLVVSHDRAFLNAVATDIIHQHGERLDYYKGNFAQFYATKSERQKQQRREYESQLQYRQHLQAFIDRWRCTFSFPFSLPSSFPFFPPYSPPSSLGTDNANRAAQAQSKIKILEKLPELEPPEEDDIVTFKFPETDKISPPLLQLSDVAFGYTKDKPLLKGVNINVALDSRLGLIGANGAGKSTLYVLVSFFVARETVLTEVREQDEALDWRAHPDERSTVEERSSSYRLFVLSLLPPPLSLTDLLLSTSRSPPPFPPYRPFSPVLLPYQTSPNTISTLSTLRSTQLCTSNGCSPVRRSSSTGNISVLSVLPFVLLSLSLLHPSLPSFSPLLLSLHKQQH
jgi:ATP-binding cassette subfamily F protein 3